MTVSCQAVPVRHAARAWLARRADWLTLYMTASLPACGGGGSDGVDDIYSATVPSAFVKPGVQVRVSAAGWTPSQMQPLTVDADSEVTIQTLPVYLFGANDWTCCARSRRPTARRTRSAPIRSCNCGWPMARPRSRAHWRPGQELKRAT